MRNEMRKPTVFSSPRHYICSKRPTRHLCSIGNSRALNPPTIFPRTLAHLGSLQKCRLIPLAVVRRLGLGGLGSLGLLFAALLLALTARLSLLGLSNLGLGLRLGARLLLLAAAAARLGLLHGLGLLLAFLVGLLVLLGLDDLDLSNT